MKGKNVIIKKIKVQPLKTMSEIERQPTLTAKTILRLLARAGIILKNN